MVEGGTVTQNVRPFEPEPDSMKIREKAAAKLTTEVNCNLCQIKCDQRYELGHFVVAWCFNSKNFTISKALSVYLK